MEVIKTLTPMEASRELNAMGLRCTPETLRFGIEQGVFPFGVCIRCDKRPVYQIYDTLFRRWIAERATAN